MFRSWVLVVCLVFICPSVFASSSEAESQNKIHAFLLHHGYDNLLLRHNKKSGQVEVDYSKSNHKRYIVRLKTPAVSPLQKQTQAHAISHKKTLKQHQAGIEAVLQQTQLIEQVHQRFFTSIYGLAVTASVNQIDTLKLHPDVESVVEDYIVKAQMGESLEVINAQEAWNGFSGQIDGLTGKGVKVAILDTGIDYSHPALGGCFGQGCKVADGYDFFYDDDDPIDVSGHARVRLKVGKTAPPNPLD